MMTLSKVQVSALVDETLTLLAECDPGGTDPTLAEAWALMVDVTQLGGARLLEAKFGGLFAAADEVTLYLGQLERVSRVISGAPFRVPDMALRPLKAGARFVEQTPDLAEVVHLLQAVPHLAAALSAYLLRTQGREARPVMDVLELAVRAGSVYRDSLTRAVPAISLI